MHRLIVTSATYRQSSKSRPELGNIDPANKLLGQALPFPGGDPLQFGAGRVRLDLEPPTLTTSTPTAGAFVHGSVALALTLRDNGTLAQTSGAGATLDGAPLLLVLGGDNVLRGSLDTTALVPGPHLIATTVRDLSGNESTLQLPFAVDNDPPRLGFKSSSTPKGRPTCFIFSGLRQLGHGRLAVDSDGTDAGCDPFKSPLVGTGDGS